VAIAQRLGLRDEAEAAGMVTRHPRAGYFKRRAGKGGGGIAGNKGRYVGSTTGRGLRFWFV
jgi:hypothetical protein